jgi:hypothetical protein
MMSGLMENIMSTNIYTNPKYAGEPHTVKCDICTKHFMCTCIDPNGCIKMCHKCEDELFVEYDYGT